MNILITGSSGLIGSELMAYFKNQGHKIYQMKRTSDETNAYYWLPEQNIIKYNESLSIDVVINLAGYSIANKRWTQKIKNRISSSRINSTKLLSQKLAAINIKPKLFISGSAIGYYGDCGNEIINESGNNGNGFLAEVCKNWEMATNAAEESGIRTIHLRLGVVISKNGGLIKKLLTPFKLFLGGVLGKGNQYMSWIGLVELCRIIDFLIHEKNIHGAVNITSPNPITNAEFTKILGGILKRPTIFFIPGIFLKLIFGEMANDMILSSTRAIPEKLQKAGYQFLDKTMIQSLKNEIN